MPETELCSARCQEWSLECSEIIGWAWDGVGCNGLQCDCVGADCDKAFASRSECEAAYQACADCLAPGPVCVGDAVVYDGSFSECTAKLGQANCYEAVNGCGYTVVCANPPDPTCAAQEVYDFDICDASGLYHWNGADCIESCRHDWAKCSGKDCDKRYASIQACQAAHSDCAKSCPPAQDIQVSTTTGCLGQTPRYYWNGKTCHPVCAAQCSGSDCDKTSELETVCLAAHYGYGCTDVCLEEIPDCLKDQTAFSGSLGQCIDAHADKCSELCNSCGACRVCAATLAKCDNVAGTYDAKLDAALSSNCVSPPPLLELVITQTGKTLTVNPSTGMPENCMLDDACICKFTNLGGDGTASIDWNAGQLNVQGPGEICVYDLAKK